MNKILRYFFYFLLGFIINKLYINKLIEGIENYDFSLLENILKERQDLGCSNFTCQRDINDNELSIWAKKENITDENYYLCNNSSENSIVSSLNIGNRCNKELCCEDISCQAKYFNEGGKCGHRVENKFHRCPIGVNSMDCEGYCCGAELKGAYVRVFDTIVNFRNKLSSDRTSRSLISGEDIRNFQYYTFLDIDVMKTISGCECSDEDYDNYDNIHRYIQGLYSNIINGATTTEDKLQNIKDAVNGSHTNPDANNIFNTDDYIKIRQQMLDVDDGANKVKGFYDQLTSTEDESSVFSENLIEQGGMYDKAQLKSNYINFLSYYTDYNPDPSTSYDVDMLKKYLKLTIILLANPLINNSDNTTLLDTTLGTTNERYKTLQITSNNFKVIF